MMLIKVLLLFLLLVGESASDVLDEINARLNKTEITQGRFTQEKQLKFLSKPLISEGEFTYHQTKGVIWKTMKPVASLLLVNSSRLLTQHGEQTLPPSFGRVFQTILGGNLGQLNDDFAVTGGNRPQAWSLQLQPKDELVKKIIAGIELSGDDELRRLEIRESNGNVSRIDFDRIGHPQQLDHEQAADFARLSP